LPENPMRAEGLPTRDAEPEPAFDILEPARFSSPLVCNSPHSGTVYPAEFLAAARLDPFTLRRTEDTLADQLFIHAADIGAPLMRARFPRCYLDVNREPYELDPRMFEGRLPALANTRSIRVAGGLGTIPRLVGEGQEIYARRLSVDEAMTRIETIYKPYHRALHGLMMRARRHFGMCVLIDCHSMPSSARATENPGGADFVIGDRYGTSCSPGITDAVSRELEKMGYTVSRNKPYAGGFNTEHYGNPGAGSHAIQIEVSRALYLNEATLEPNEGFVRTQQALRRVLAALASHVSGIMASGRLAAE
jgi:N-formylglutamate amidohydrolase